MRLAYRAIAAACVVLAAAHPASAQARLGGGGALDISLGRIILSFLACAAIAACAIVALRQRFGGRSSATPTKWAGGVGVLSRLERRNGRIQVIESRRLSIHADISLVRCDGQEYLLVLQSGATQILAEKPVPGGADACR